MVVLIYLLFALSFGGPHWTFPWWIWLIVLVGYGADLIEKKYQKMLDKEEQYRQQERKIYL